MLEADLILPQVPGVLQANGGLRALNPDEENLLYSAGIDIIDYIKARWPVATGTSQDAWSFQTLADPMHGYGVRVENSTYYVEYVHYKGTPADPPLWEGLLQDAWDQFKGGLLRALTAAIQQTYQQSLQQPLQPVGRARRTRNQPTAVQGLVNLLQRLQGVP